LKITFLSGIPLIFLVENLEKNTNRFLTRGSAPGQFIPLSGSKVFDFSPRSPLKIFPGQSSRKRAGKKVFKKIGKFCSPFFSQKAFLFL